MCINNLCGGEWLDLYPGYLPLICIEQEAGWAPEPVWNLWEENNLLFVLETGTTSWLSSLQPDHYTV
jgi:hypothetical protein